MSISICCSARHRARRISAIMADAGPSNQLNPGPVLQPGPQLANAAQAIAAGPLQVQQPPQQHITQQQQVMQQPAPQINLCLLHQYCRFYVSV